jgi:hypothetical protein
MGIAQVGAQANLNYLAGNVVTIRQATAPTWVPGLCWVPSVIVGSLAANVPCTWNSSAWVADTGARYLALLSADPGEATTIAALTEITTPGYARQLVTFANATAADPSIIQNTAPIVFGPMTADMAVAAGWAALVTVVSGVTGLCLYTWPLTPPERVAISQTVDVATGFCQIQE